MKQTILTAVTAAAIAFSPVASTPARAADPHDVIVPLLGLAVLGAVLNERRNDREARANQTRRRVVTSEPRYREYDDRGRYRNDRRREKTLPGQCLRVAEGRRNDRIVFPERCLNRAGIRTRDLPRRCEFRLPVRRGRLDVFGARCLADAGWTLPRIATRRR